MSKPTSRRPPALVYTVRLRTPPAKSHRVTAACAEHARPHAARVGHDGRLEHDAAAAHGVDGVGASAASAAMRPKRESAARSTKPPTAICVRRSTLHRLPAADREAVLELLPQLRDGLEPRTSASESSTGCCRRASAARCRRPAAGDPSCCRYSGAPTCRRLGRGLGDPPRFQIGRLGAPNLLPPAWARCSWSAGLRWAG